MSSPSQQQQTEFVVEEFYKKREKIQPRKVKGLFAKLRILGVALLLGLYYFLPWINLNGSQAVLLDLPARKFHFFGITFWPQDFFYLAVLLIIAALALFFFTTLAGRLWCGYACPQTVWTEVFMWIEHYVEGDRPQRLKLDKAPMTARKFRIRGTKHAIWVTFSLWTGFTFVGFFTPIRELGFSLADFSLGPWEWFWILFYSFATYGNAGWMREQVCTYMCPYARFQSAMFDKDTLIISYDTERGEPRGKRKRKLDYKSAGLGSCVDCTMCVQVCPTGIDIRDGLQYQCIGCAACIDVCDDVMERMGYEKGLIRYTTENTLEGKQTHILRPRMILYALVLTGMIIGLGVSIATRIPLELNIIRDRNALYREASNGLVENIYTLKVINMDEQSHHYSLDISGIQGLEVIGLKDEEIQSGEVKEMIISIRVDPIELKSTSTELLFHIEAVDNPDIQQDQKARFLGPLVN
ncbi:MAG TPA: cytochrome c oxidase accessory protein CcoG [Gammaproteobacteria bacterium]|nr:cytochrome c oxidase accessory protein CcoG [Gammaproteobacteria bacterium]